MRLFKVCPVSLWISSIFSSTLNYILLGVLTKSHAQQLRGFCGWRMILLKSCHQLQHPGGFLAPISKHKTATQISNSLILAGPLQFLYSDFTCLPGQISWIKPERLALQFLILLARGWPRLRYLILPNLPCQEMVGKNGFVVRRWWSQVLG